MMMKRLILSNLLLLAGVLTIFASRALSIPYTYTQPDGSIVTLTLYGDEHASWLSMDDGTIVVQQDNGYYLAQIDEAGLLSATKLLAHEPDKRTAVEQKYCLQQQHRHHVFYRKAGELQQAARRAQVTNTSYFPHTGNPKCLVILAQFSDVHFVSDDPKAQFEQYFKGEEQVDLGHNEQKNICSVASYFEWSSQGQFKPQFDIVGPITLPETMEYYGHDSGGTKDVNFSQFCKDAIAAVDDQVDFNDYDANGNGRAELICIVYAGYGQNVGGNPVNSLWPKCGYKGISTSDNVRVGYINCCAELFSFKEDDPVASTNINGIGVCVHEFSHGMGLPDLYATSTDSQINNQTPEYWDLMDYGEYASSGYSPVPYTAWEQAAMGWIEVEELTASQHIEMKSLIKGGKAYKFGNGADPEEWFMIEYADTADTESHIPGFNIAKSVTVDKVKKPLSMHGLLVWHIAYPYKMVNMNDYPNDTPSMPNVCLVPADGLVINGYLQGKNKTYSTAEYALSLCGDAFPGTSGVTELTADMNLPNYLFYSGETIPPFKIKNIQEDTENGVVAFDFHYTSEVIAGDANGDGAVNVTDIVEMVNYILGKPSANFNKEAADVNGDGEVNVTDVVKVVNIILSVDNKE